MAARGFMGRDSRVRRHEGQRFDFFVTAVLIPFAVARKCRAGTHTLTRHSLTFMLPR